MNDGRWYAATTLMANLLTHHDDQQAASEKQVERWMRDRYPEAEEGPSVFYRQAADLTNPTLVLVRS